jgi:hypothetical protein
VLRDVVLGTLALLAVTFALWLVHVFGRTLPTAALGAIWAAVTVTIAAALLRRARIRRAVALAGYLRPASVLHRWLRGGWLMAAVCLALAAVIGLALLIAVVRLDDRTAWSALVASAPALVAARAFLARGLSAHASAIYLPELAWRLAAAGVGVLLVAALVWLGFHRSYPDFGTATLEQAVWHLVDAERARSAPAETLLQLAAAKDALTLWLAQQLMPEPGGSLADAMGWLVVLAEETLFVWSYLTVCSAVLLGGGYSDHDAAKTV